MKPTLRTLATLLMITTILASCSVQKRRYNKGWHIDWMASHNSTPKKEQHPAPVKTYTTKTIAETTNMIVVSAQAAEQKNSTDKNTTQHPSRASVGHPSQQAQTPMTMAISMMKNKIRPLNTSSKTRGFDNSDNTDFLSVFSLVCGILGIFILAIIFGVIALRGYREGRGDSNMKIFAQIGLILGIIEVILLILVLTIFLAAFSV